MKTVQLRRLGDLIKAAPNNYNRTKSAFGDYQFPADEFDTRVKHALEKGYVPEFVECITAALIKPMPVKPPADTIDHERGILKCVNGSYVVDCVSLRLVPVERARFIGVSKGLPYWITEGDDIAEVETIYPSVFGDRDPKNYPRSVKL